jgi:type I restriction enzyme S subunit
MAGEWRDLRWGDLAILQYGRAFRSHGTSAGPYRVFGTNGPIGWHDEVLCSHASVVIGRKGAYRGVHYSPDPFFVIDTAFYLEPKTEIDIRWAYYELRTQDINGMDSGSAIPSTSRDAFYRLPVRVPPLPEQRAIAHILGSLDDKIDLNRRTNETLEAMARALFKSWFVDFDPVRAKAQGRDPGLPAHLAALFPDRLVESELGEIPEGWEMQSLDEIARFLNGLALQKYPAQDGHSLPVIKIAQLRAGNTDGADQASAGLEPEYIVEDGDVLFSWSGSLECVLWAGGHGALNQHLFKVTSDKYPKWLCFMAVHHHLDDFRHIAAGKATTMGHIQRHHLSDAKLAVPPAKLVQEMDAVVSPIMERTWRRSVESRTLAALRDALLPKLISGEVRVE